MFCTVKDDTGHIVSFDTGQVTFVTKFKTKVVITTVAGETIKVTDEASIKKLLEAVRNKKIY